MYEIRGEKYNLILVAARYKNGIFINKIDLRNRQLLIINCFNKYTTVTMKKYSKHNFIINKDRTREIQKFTALMIFKAQHICLEHAEKIKQKILFYFLH